MGEDACVSNDSFPRQKARTRGFQLGRPRGFTLSEDGTRLLFIRSNGGTDPNGNLWCLDAAGERLLVEASALTAVDAELPAAERARRERMREVTSGITSFTADRDCRTVVLTIAGIPYVIDTESAQARELPAPGPVVDPRINPAGTHAAYVVDGSFYLCELATMSLRCLAEGSEGITWGLADFIAAEELERMRGYWWLDDAVLVQSTDDRMVEQVVIADPALPTQPAQVHRYPFAGTANAEIELWVIAFDGSIAQVEWDHVRYPYLCTVHRSEGGTLLSFLSRDQRMQWIARLDDSQLHEVAVRTDECWVDVVHGVPALTDDGRLVDVLPDAGTMRVNVDGNPISPVGLQVGAVMSIEADHLIVLASPEPTAQAAYRLHFDGTCTAIDRTDAVCSVIARGDSSVTVTASLDSPRTAFIARMHGTEHVIASHAQTPIIEPQPILMRAGERDLECALLLPRDHDGSSLPVIMSPYGGPHAQRVVRASGAFATEQWLADQGYAVLVVDGRGTPGRGPDWDRAVHLDLAAPVLQDQVDGLQAVAALHPELDLTRVGIRGWSFGGYLAALAVMDRPDVFHAAVAGAPVTEWRLYDTAYTERYLGSPMIDAGPYDRCSLITRAASLTRPLLLIHGLADDNVLAAHTLQLSSALLAAGRVHSVLPLSGVTHMTPQEIVAENLLRAEVEFFDAALRD